MGTCHLFRGVASSINGAFIMIGHVILMVLVGGAMSQTAAPAQDVETQLSKRPHYSMLLDLLKTTGLLDQLKALPQMTLFAPTNAALSDMPNDEYNALKADTARLTEFLKYHVTTDEAWHTKGSDNDKVFKSLSNSLPIRINVYKTLHTVSAEGENITEPNIKVANGWVQGIGSVMEPPQGDIVDVINSFGETSILAGLLAASGLDSVLRADQNITVFAPTNEAFEGMDDQILTYLQQNPALLEEVLLYHVVQKTTLYRIGMRHTLTFQTSDHHKDVLMIREEDDDDAIFLNHAVIEDADISAINGVMHTISDVLIPSTVLVELEDQGFGHLIGRK